MFSSVAPQLCTTNFTQFSNIIDMRKNQSREKGQTLIYELLEFINGFFFRDDPHWFRSRFLCSQTEFPREK